MFGVLLLALCGIRPKSSCMYSILELQHISMELEVDDAHQLVNTTTDENPQLHVGVHVS